jgi:hypothetical protein
VPLEFCQDGHSGDDAGLAGGLRLLQVSVVGINNADGTYDFYARGKYDQIVRAAPRKDMVIVRLGNAPDGSVQWPLALRALVHWMPEK